MKLFKSKKYRGNGKKIYKSQFDSKIDLIMELDKLGLSLRKIIFYIGVFISFFSFMYILYLLLQKFLYKTVLTGWTSLIVSIWFLGGLIVLSIGAVGIYISKIFIEVFLSPDLVDIDILLLLKKLNYFNYIVY